ncbi:hypothetical protein SynBMKMC1_00038 [Synechococcus sp. BMK-MC-1]|nr:hypothetical protein SynBMKMC1_00038 [Synechococcus sp. BMK-MC-1]
MKCAVTTTIVNVFKTAFWRFRCECLGTVSAPLFLSLKGIR